MIKDKIILSRVFEFEGQYSAASFYTRVAYICGEMDIPVPVVLKKHSAHFDKFSNTRFRAGDFVESVSFDSMVFEHMPEDKKKPSSANLTITKPGDPNPFD